MWEKDTNNDAMAACDKAEEPIAIKENTADAVLPIQLFICIGTVIIVLLIKMLAGDLFTDLRTEYSAIMRNGIDVSGQGELLRFANTAVDNVRMAVLDILAQIDVQGAAGGYHPLSAAAVPQGASNCNYKLTDKIFCPCNGMVSSHFGARLNPILHKADFHTGLDIAAASGSAVYAAFHGTVQERGYTPLRGNYIIILHSAKLSTLYQHLQYSLVREGEQVKRGEYIASVGSTGLSTGAHLHFEVRIDDICVNPSKAIIFDEL